MDKTPMTARGAAALQAELNELKGVARPKVIKAIAEAREHGDLKENAEYHAAREQQGFIEGRLQDLEAKLSNAQIIDPASLNTGGKIVFGATVDLLDVENDSEVTYQLVGEDESDIKLGRISITSPIARALIGKFVDDVAEVQAPGGIREYEVLDIRYI